MHSCPVQPKRKYGISNPKGGQGMVNDTFSCSCQADPCRCENALSGHCQGLSQSLNPQAHHRAVRDCPDWTHSNQEHFKEPSMRVWREKGALLVNLSLSTATTLHFAWTILTLFPPFSCLRYLQKAKPRNICVHSKALLLFF